MTEYITREEAIQIAKDIMAEAEKAREASSLGILRRYDHMPEIDYCRVCGGRDHQCDQNVVERSVAKDKEIYTITHAQIEKIGELQNELEACRTALGQERARRPSITQDAFDNVELLTKALEAEKAKNAELVSFNNKASAEIERLDKEVDQLRVQLAGCGVAALGGTDPDKCQVAKKGDYGWSPAYQDTLELRRKYDELAGTVERQKRHLEIKDADIKKLQGENAEHVKARKGQVERIDHLVEKASLKDSIISGLVDDVKKAKGRLLDVVARDDNKEIEKLKRALAEQGQVGADLFNECKRLQGAREDLELTLKAAVKKLNLERYCYQSLSELRDEIESMPMMAPARDYIMKEIKYTIPGVANTCTPPAQNAHSTCTAGHVGCNCKTSGAPTWPAKDKAKSVGAEQHDPGRAVGGSAKCARCGGALIWVGVRGDVCDDCLAEHKKKVEVPNG